ncbi:MAG: homogentisate 1,2-dioxygenase [Myxococcales bacterium]|nr:homogentisate 1,2-dioxygenase [Myxococcales bacterium]
MPPMSKVETLYVAGGLPRLAARLAELGTKKVLVLAPPSRRHVDDVVAALAGFAPVVFDGARVHVPVEVVEAAAAQLASSGADTIVAVGGGSAIGLGKALRLASAVRFAAVPTTYAGSEMTTMFGITRARDKQTGRDARVRPDLVLYDVALTESMPIALTAQSLCNSLAHVASVLSTGWVDEAHRVEAFAAAALVIRALEDLLLAPDDRRAREQALRGASACAIAFDRGTAGMQHKLAHVIGGATGVDHAALHAVLLPQFLAHVRTGNESLIEHLEHDIGRADIDSYVHDLLVRAGAPVSLDALGIKPETVRELLGAFTSDAQFVLDAQHGLRPPGSAGRIDLGLSPLALLAGAHPAQARRIVLALHGRGAEAGTITRRLREIAGHDPTIAIVGLRAAEGAERWYGVRYGEPGAGSQPEVLAAIQRVETAIAALRSLNRDPTVPVLLAGFSQGACLALEVAARHAGALAGVFAPSGARIGQATEWSPASSERLAGIPVVLGAADADRWIAHADLEATAAWFRAAGASVDVLDTQGDRHEITLAQRLRGREVVLGARAAEGSTGFGNTLTSEAIAGAVPPLQNSPRLGPSGLYAEQINGTGFTAARTENQRTWMYRVRPSSQRRSFHAFVQPRVTGSFHGAPEINLCGFAPLGLPADERDFVDGLTTVCGAGDAAMRRGYAFHLYAANRSMDRRAFYTADGDLLILPEHGALTVVTELGVLEVAPGHVALLPRGIVFSVLLRESTARGYVAEAFGRHFRLPDRGPVGANGLADARHFRAPAPWFEDRLAPGFEIVAKLGGHLHVATQDHSPFDVAGWHGNYAPFVYDLAAFSPSGNIRFDHGDPSIHTVLSAPLDEPGSHTLDLVTFPPRWDPTTGTFRPPFFHRNVTSEINGIVRESVHPGSAFQPGCTFLTPALTAHGVSARAVEHSRTSEEAVADHPVHLGVDSLWFQLESALPPVLTPWGVAHRLPGWPATWGSHPSYFTR